MTLGQVPKIWRVVFVMALVNFATYMVAAAYLGGDAISGKVDGNHFYLASHGRYTEVSEAVFAYSKIHARSVWVTHSIAILGGLFLWWRRPR